MCFSAAGSFGIAAVLVGTGVVSMRQTHARALRPLAVVPLLFAAQQIAEGMVWSTIDDPRPGRLHLLAVASFLAFAVVIWPTWMPLALLSAETRPRRRWALRALLAVGVGVSSFAAWRLLDGDALARVNGRSLGYGDPHLTSARVFALYLPVYVVATVVPFFVSSMSRARLLGAVLVASLLAAFLIKREALTSVWCFFAAILSGVIVLAIAAEQRLPPTAPVVSPGALPGPAA